ncbi:preprotein translocase subunit SecA [compost metagenome]
MQKNNLINRFFGTKNGRTLNKTRKVLDRVNSFSQQMMDLSDAELFERSVSLREKACTEPSLDDVLPEAFALCREVSGRVLGMRHYDVQVMGGIILNSGCIAEMRTGEGKTLVSSLPAYLNGLAGKQVHIVTVNDYLAKRDALLMMPLYEALGMSVGYLQSDMKSDERRAVYSGCNVIYGTSSEFAFDYLRDNIATSADSLLQKDLFYVIIDEVDSVLIDEARIPLVISREDEVRSSNIEILSPLVKSVSCMTVVDFDKNDPNQHSEQDVILSLKSKSAHITEKGFRALEQGLISANVIADAGELYTQTHLGLIELFSTMLRAIYLFEKDKDYVVVDGKVKIINQNTGRIEHGKRWNDGLHQAVEHKENLEILPDNKAMAAISLQNFFRLYEKISGMTGTADTDAYELMEVYGLDVVVIPTHRPLIRTDMPDQFYIKNDDKIQVIISEIISMHKSGRPVLVGTTSVEESEKISSRLRAIKDDSGYPDGLPHNVLNAKNHEQEASIVAMAGRPGAITIATNMAGRGTDIILGGNAKEIAKMLVLDDESSVSAIKESCHKAAKTVADNGGLHVIGTSRNYSRRIDNQLIGRAGRQGDPGSSVFFVSLEDELMKIFGGERFGALFKSIGMDEDQSISHPFIDKAIRDAQKKIEGQHYNIRKELLKYDDINNMQRHEIYAIRREWLQGNDIGTKAAEFMSGSLESAMNTFIPINACYEEVDFSHMELSIRSHWGIHNNLSAMANMDVFNPHEIRKLISEQVISATKEIEERIGTAHYQSLAQQVMIDIIDRYWIEQIGALNNLRDGIHLRGYAQKNPVHEYSLESLKMFTDMIEKMKAEYISNFFMYARQTIAYLEGIADTDEVISTDLA